MNNLLKAHTQTPPDMHPTLCAPRATVAGCERSIHARALRQVPSEMSGLMQTVRYRVSEIKPTRISGQSCTEQY